MKAKFASRCHGCDKRIELGDEVVGYPPKGNRRTWLVFHPGCTSSYCGGEPPRKEAWRKNREWMTDAEWDDLCAAMAKQVSPGPPLHQPGLQRERRTAESVALDAELARRMLDPAA